MLGWATGSWTHIDSTAVAISLVGACLFFQVVTWDDLLDKRSAWTTFVWYAGIIGIAGGLAERGVRAADLPELAAHAVKDACIFTNPRRVSPGDAQAIYGDAT